MCNKLCRWLRNQGFYFYMFWGSWIGMIGFGAVYLTLCPKSCSNENMVQIWHNLAYLCFLINFASIIGLSYNSERENIRKFELIMGILGQLIYIVLDTLPWFMSDNEEESKVFVRELIQMMLIYPTRTILIYYSKKVNRKGMMPHMKTLNLVFLTIFIAQCIHHVPWRKNIMTYLIIFIYFNIELSVMTLRCALNYYYHELDEMWEKKQWVHFSLACLYFAIIIFKEIFYSIDLENRCCDLVDIYWFVTGMELLILIGFIVNNIKLKNTPPLEETEPLMGVVSGGSGGARPEGVSMPGVHGTQSNGSGGGV